MIKLLVALLILPFYIIYLFLKIIIYLINLFDNLHTKGQNESNNYSIKNDRLNKLNGIDMDCEPKHKALLPRKKGFELVSPTDVQYKITIDKIQEIYKNLGFNVKVIDIKKNKYNTEYEIIFSLQKTTQYDILAVSNRVIDKFDIDGVKIASRSKKINKIFLTVPLEYK